MKLKKVKYGQGFSVKEKGKTMLYLKAYPNTDLEIEHSETLVVNISPDENFGTVDVFDSNIEVEIGYTAVWSEGLGNSTISVTAY